MPIRPQLKTVLKKTIRQGRNSVVFFTGAICLFLLSTNDAAASLKQCRALRHELGSLNTIKTGSFLQKNKKFQHFDSLVKRQEQVLKFTQKSAVQQRCISRLGKRTGQGTASCPVLLRKISRMRANLASLKRRRDNNAGSISPASIKTDRRARRRAIKRQMSSLRCRQLERRATLQEQGADNRPRNRRPGLFARLFGTRRSPTHRGIYTPRSEVRAVGSVFRTMCVRISDGYYFPVSFATVRSSFSKDNAHCQASKIGEEMRLFFHRNPSEETEDMVDLQGNAYVNLQNAFLYRTKVLDQHKAPRITKTKGLIQIAGGGLKRPTHTRATALADIYRYNPNIPEKPAPKPGLFADPDTQMAQIGAFQLKQVNPTGSDTRSDAISSITYDPQTIIASGIRIVGPTFLADQESAKLLLAPDQIEVR